jgi:hypothetical protein
MAPKRVEALAWVLLYSGLLFVSLGLFVQRSDAVLGWAITVVGAVDAAAGVLMIWLRSRMKDDSEKETP